MGGHLQRDGELQQRIHFGGVKLMSCFQVTVNLRQFLQPIHIHDLWTFPVEQFSGLLQ